MYMKNNHMCEHEAAVVFICPVWNVAQALMGIMVSSTFGSLMDHVRLLHFQKSVTLKWPSTCSPHIKASRRNPLDIMLD